MGEGETAALFADPQHPYTQALLEAIPVADPRRRDERRRADRRVAQEAAAATDAAEVTS